ncbi:MAG: glycosyltransferase family 39 protein [Candidatus Aureabacteria bacterium]|nr:glycosyltransferase family 39 protein [Candidatus Auribacterota bacterium]
MTKKNSAVKAILLLFSILGSILILFSTRWGIGITPDSITYILSAENIAKGKGFAVLLNNKELMPVTHYPPLFPFILSFLSKLNLSIIQASVLLNVSLLCSTVFLSGYFIYKSTSSLAFTVICQVLIFSFLDFQVIHAMALSEPLFIFLCLATILSFIKYLEKGSSFVLIFTAVLSSMAFLTRYAGISLFFACLAGIFILDKINWKKRIKNSMIFIVINLIPILLWISRNVSLAGNAFNRKLSFHALSSFETGLALNSFSRWILPPGYPTKISAILFPLFFVGISILIIFIFLTKKSGTKKAQSELSFMLIFIFSYLYLVVFSFMFIDASIPFSYRMLSPLYLPFFMFITIPAYFLKNVSGKFVPVLKTFLIITFVLFSMSYIYTAFKFVSESFRDGIGLNSKIWHTSEIINTVKSLPSEVPIYTNGRSILSFHTKKTVKGIPHIYHSKTKKENENFKQEMRNMVHDLSSHNGIIVYINQINWKRYMPREKDLQKVLKLHYLQKDSLGSIYKLPDA